MSARHAAERETPMRREDAPLGLFLDAHGAWYHDGDFVRHERLCALLTRSIARADDGGLIVTTGRDVLPFSAARAPFQVTTLHRDGEGWMAVLSDGAQEHLSTASTIVATLSGHFFVVVKDGQYWAECSRSAGQAMASALDDDGAGAFVLRGPPHLAVEVIEERDWSAVPAL